jgi:hypothetical protein
MSVDSSEEDSNSELECNDCNSVQAKKCDICDEVLCPEHMTGYIKEWLMYEDEFCAKCRKSGCHNCMITCFSCANQGDHSSWYCKSCCKKYKLLKNIKCEYHSWYKCDEKHDFDQDDECPECRSNRNYCGKMEW